ncbi:MAG: aminomethyl-transferring glycine dehydrogenase subunit GcvPA [Thermogutta sp.]|nr:aminomethyl-transferring glycine dehydrogenase subunit GcvPA [Thermogutta sp.]
MAYLPQSEDDIKRMLEAVGVASVEDLFSHIPPDVRFSGRLNLPPALSEAALQQHMEGLAARNSGTDRTVSFLGGGCYDHFIPAAVDFVASRSEFYTSYTPYQPEVSQGNLQALFEYQTLIARLFGMDVSNGGLYDGATAAAEAVLMAIAARSGKRKVLVPETLHPEYRRVLQTYTANVEISLSTLSAPRGRLDAETVAKQCDAKTACVVIQQPNFFGCVEPLDALIRAAHEAGVPAVVVADPISMGLLKRPGDLGADLVAAEGQALGIPQQWGGPFLGILACREQFLRRMPGRIAGQTTDRNGKRCWVLTLQTREQHIRREKATSNICTNQHLMAVRAAVYLALLGPHGLRKAAHLCLHKARYAAKAWTEGTGLKLAFEAPFFKEFVLRAENAAEAARLQERALEAGFFAGTALGQWYPDLQDAILLAVTEQRTREQIDALARCFTCGRQGSPTSRHAAR